MLKTIDKKIKHDILNHDFVKNNTFALPNKNHELAYVGMGERNAYYTVYTYPCKYPIRCAYTDMIDNSKSSSLHLPKKYLRQMIANYNFFINALNLMEKAKL